MTVHASPAPARQRFFEDYVVGEVHPLGKVSIDAAQIVEFARRYDPQAFHTDEDAAKDSLFGGLIASGWQTASLMMRVFAQSYLSQDSSLGSPGVDELRWLKPVRPGDTLSVRATVLECEPSRSKPDRGLVRSLIEVFNQDDELVMTVKAMNLILRAGARSGTGSA